MRKQYPDAVVLPSSDELPAPSQRNYEMKPPVNPLAIGYRLIRGVLHQLKAAEPDHHQRPQLNVPTQDARWFRLSTLDGATVTTADGRGAVYRQRDRDKMFALLWQSLRRQRQLLRRFDEMRRAYRDALPVLSSKEKWETVLLEAPAAQAQSNAAGNGRHHG